MKPGRQQLPNPCSGTCPLPRVLSRCLALLVVWLTALPAQGQQSERFGDFEIHYSVVNTTFLAPEVSAQYGIVRGKHRAILNLAVREHQAQGGSVARTAKLEGRTWDLFQNQFFEFQEIKEGDAIYYIGEFKFSDAELRFFDVTFLPDGASRSYRLKFQHKVYID